MHRKKLLIDARLLYQTGVGTYLKNLLHYVPHFIDEQIEIHVLLRNIDNASVLPSGMYIHTTDITWHTLNEQLLLSDYIDSLNMDLVHYPYFSYPVFAKTKFIATIHDIIPLLYKTGKASTRHPLIYAIKHKALQYSLSRQLKNSELIITPSKSTKEQLLSYFGSKYDNKIIPIYEGVSHELLNIQPKKPKNLQLKNYYMIIGNANPHKNIEFVLKDWDSKKNLVLVGPKNNFSHELSHYASPNIQFLHFLASEELAYVYLHAKALIQPSLCEGFGLPLLEASLFGKSVIASKIPVFDELLNENYIAFSPYDKQSLYSALENFELDDVQPIADVSSFTFEKMVKETCIHYHKILL